MTEQDTQPRLYDYLILGAGPAGVQLAYFLHEAGRDYLMLEAGDSPGTFFKSKPRHRRLISINKVHTGYDDPELKLRWDWNSLLSNDERLLFTHHSKKYFPPADKLVEYLDNFAQEAELHLATDVRVERVSRDADSTFRLTDDQGRQYRGRRLVVATGVQEPFMPDIPGIEETENYADIPLASEHYADQRVLVLGKGNSAFETAEPLIETAAVIHVCSPQPIQFAWQTHFVGHLRALNNNFLDTYQLKSQNAVLDATVEKIERTADGRFAVTMNYTHAGGERETLWYDRVINCTGFRFDASIFDDSCRPSLVRHGRLPDQTSDWESTDVPDLYFAGTLMQVRDYKKTTSAFIHGFRYNLRCLAKIFGERYHGEEMPSEEIPATSDGLFEATIARINTTSALWQQFGFLGDVMVVEGDTARYYEELPMDWIGEGKLDDRDSIFTMTLEFGPAQVDPFQIERKPDPSKAAESAFLHPVIRHFRNGREVAVIHLLEDLYGEWHNPETHHRPLRQFFADQLAGPEVSAPAEAGALRLSSTPGRV